MKSFDMMTPEEMAQEYRKAAIVRAKNTLGNLSLVYNKYKDKHVPTFQLNIAEMTWDVSNVIEELVAILEKDIEVEQNDN